MPFEFTNLTMNVNSVFSDMILPTDASGFYGGWGNGKFMPQGIAGRMQPISILKSQGRGYYYQQNTTKL